MTVFDEDVDPRVEEALREAMEPVAHLSEYAIDDLLLLELLLRDADDNILRALGSRARTILRAVEAARAEEQEQGRLGPLPDVDDIVRFAASEASELGGWGTAVAPIHVVLALFAFHGARSERVLTSCGVEWRPLRSMTRRLGLSW